MFSSEKLLSEWIFGISIHGKWLFKSVISPYGDLKVVFFFPPLLALFHEDFLKMSQI